MASPSIDLSEESSPATSETLIIPSSSDFSASPSSTTSPLLESVSLQPDPTSDQKTRDLIASSQQKSEMQAQRISRSRKPEEGIVREDQLRQ
ncbi:hypothetical protein U1Q18_006763 [Sarracenia purpurea var. burkii]